MRSPALCLAVLGFSAAFAFAQEAATVKSGGDRLVAGGSVRHTEAVSGDFFGMGGDIELVAPVQGDAIVAGGNVRVSGPVGGDLIAGGGNVVVSGPVARNAVLAGGNVEIAATAEILGDLSVAGGDVDVRGAVFGSVHAGAGDLLIDSRIEGDVHAGTGSLTLGPNARIAGRVVHRGGKVTQDPAAEVAGGIERAKSRPPRGNHPEFVHHRSGGGWFWTVGVIALAALLAGAFPAASGRIGSELRAQPGLALLFGLLALVCVPIAALVFMITIIGIPVAIVVLLLYFVLLLVGYAASGVMLGEAALRKWREADAARLGYRIGAAVLAMLLLALLGRIPFLGGLVVFAALLAGIGAIVMAIARRPPPAAPV